jgi:hypothetical protein
MLRHFPFLDNLYFKLIIETLLKFRYSEKATKVKKNLPLCFDVAKYFQNKVRGFFKYFGLLTISELKFQIDPD